MATNLLHCSVRIHLFLSGGSHRGSHPPNSGRCADCRYKGENRERCSASEAAHREPHTQSRGAVLAAGCYVGVNVFTYCCRLGVAMAELPHVNPAEPSPDRLWKRVRHIESNLGYSNLAFEGFPGRHNNVHGARNRQWQADIFDPPSHHRKRRMPKVGVSSRVQGSAPQRDLLNSRSIPALSLPSKEHSTPPWTQPISQHDFGRGSLPRLPEPPQESKRNRALGGGQENSIATILGAAETVGERRHAEASLSSLSSDQGPGGGLSPGRLSKANRVDCPVQIQALTERNCADDHEVGSGGGVRTAPCEVAGGAVGAAFDAKDSDAPSDLDITPKAVESQEQRSFVVRTLPSGKKLRAVRAGRCRSLVSPNNKVFSSTVVARVKQGLQNGDDDKRPKVLLVGSGTFNPIHKIHIRRFYLARNFLQAQKGVSGKIPPFAIVHMHEREFHS